MDNLYNTIYNLINDINIQRNSINNFFYTDSIIVGNILSAANGLITINTAVDILNTTQLELHTPNTCALYIAGGTHINKNLLVNGNIYCNNNFNIFGNFTISNSLISNGDIIVLGNTFTDILYANTIIANYITGNIASFQINDGANINSLRANNIVIFNVTNFNANSITFNKLTITNTFNTNNINANIININENITGNYLEVYNNANIANNLRVLGGANISGNVSVNGNMVVYGNLELKNKITLNGNVNIYGSLNLYNSNVTLYNKIVSNNDLIIKGTLYCNDIFSNSSINIIGVDDIVANVPLYSNINLIQNFANIELIRENRYITLRLLDNISGTIENTTPYIYANLGNILNSERYIPIKNINKNSLLTDGTNIGYNFLLSGNINNNNEFINMFYPDYTINNIGSIRFTRLNNLDWQINQSFQIYKFNFSFLV